jgi:TRAP-type mannitol/chloroaromatic compound transport system permease small subunit
MQPLLNAIEKVITIIGKTIAWFTLIMVIVTALIVLLRYAFNTGWIAMQESVIYMHATVFLLSAAYALNCNAHVRVDIFYSRFSDKNKAIVDALGTIIFLLPVCIFILWSSWEYVMSSWELQETSREAGGLPFVYILKTNLILMPLLLMAQGILQLIKSIILISNKNGSATEAAQ